MHLRVETESEKEIMSYQNPHKKPSIALMTVIAFLAIVPTLWAQTERRKPQGTSTTKTLIFKGSGVPRMPQDPGPNPPSPPLPLSVVEKNQLLKSLNLPALTGPGSVYVRLSARDTYVADKGFLHFRNANVVSGVKSHQATRIGRLHLMRRRNS
jgi:hypothetical protein